MSLDKFLTMPIEELIDKFNKGEITQGEFIYGASSLRLLHSIFDEEIENEKESK
jgi:hypothetical protein